MYIFLGWNFIVFYSKPTPWFYLSDQVSLLLYFEQFYQISYGCFDYCRWGLEKKIEEYPEKETTTKDKEKEQEKEKDNKKDKNKKVLLVAFPSKKKEVHKVPSTRLAISEDGEYLAVGASDGSIVVTKSENLQPVKRLAKHDLPVTGLGFAPHHLTKERGITIFALPFSILLFTLSFFLFKRIGIFGGIMLSR
jgi:hypothetical protein